MDALNYREVLTKRPFWRVLPDGYMDHGSLGPRRDDDYTAEMPEDHIWRVPFTQADFLREYFPSGHQIFDKNKYPDIYKKDPETGKWYEQPITRTAFAFQQLIATKHILHITGNDIQFEISDGGEDQSKQEKYQKNLIKFKKVWLNADMEVVHYEAVRSLMITGDAAVVGYIDEGKFGAKTLSYLNGDTLYPHFDSITGKLKLFARKYYDYADDGTERTEWIEVWDDTYLYRYRKDVTQKGKLENIIDKIFGLGGYVLAEQPKKHGFPFIPVAYIRNEDGPCWHAVQKNIEDYEEAFSYLCENNKAYAFPIMYLKGDGDDIMVIGNNNGAAKLIQIADKEGEAGFLNGTDASNAFATQLDKAYNLIYELSFTVKPPELKSGDLPGVAIKLLYSPAIEVAMNDAQMMKPFLNKIVKMTQFGAGYEENNVQTMLGLPINCWIETYVHMNQAELVTNIATAVQNKFLSRQTASERCPNFPKNDEFDRIMREEKQKQEMDLLVQMQSQDNQTQNNIEEQEAQARIDMGKGGEDINTGRGAKGGKRGRPNKTGKTWDKNGNFLGESNWDAFNRTH